MSSSSCQVHCFGRWNRVCRWSLVTALCEAFPGQVPGVGESMLCTHAGYHSRTAVFTCGLQGRISDVLHTINNSNKIRVMK